MVAWEHRCAAEWLRGAVRAHDVAGGEPERTIAFYQALGFELGRELPIVRDGELEATNYFLGIAGSDEPELELTFNHDGRGYELGTACGHIALAVDDLTGTLAALAVQGLSRSGRRIRCGRAVASWRWSATRSTVPGRADRSTVGVAGHPSVDAIQALPEPFRETLDRTGGSLVAVAVSHESVLTVVRRRSLTSRML
jgi:hypothetical protein